MNYTKISYENLKTAFGFFIISDIRQRIGKEKPTEADVRKLFLKLDKNRNSEELKSAKQLSRYCDTDKNYLVSAREETFENLAKMLNLKIQNLSDFRQKLNPAFKTFNDFQEFLTLSENYLTKFSSQKSSENQADLKQKFMQFFGISEQSQSFISMISYNFGEKDSNLPAFTFAAENDLKTERVLKDLFKEFNSKIPQTIPSLEAIEKIKKKEQKGTFFAIGLANNDLTKWAISQKNIINLLEFDEKNTCIRLFGEKTEEFRANRNEKIDYAIIIKLGLKKQKSIFVLGGIEGFGTEKIGEYFQENWQKIADFRDEKTGKIISGKSFLAVFKISKNDFELIKCEIIF